MDLDQVRDVHGHFLDLSVVKSLEFLHDSDIIVRNKVNGNTFFGQTDHYGQCDANSSQCFGAARS